MEDKQRYLVAVSGGIDSVVLLDLLMDQNRAGQSDHELLVAHFDHGIREDSAKDADFVRKLAMQCELPYISKREDLGSGASEEQARERRYRFLRQAAKECQADKILTGHHLDDMVETLLINLMRGTGWRGLAVLNAEDVERPLVGWQKKDILKYAKEKNLKWSEDSTNQSNDYTRNIVRRKWSFDEDIKRQLQLLHQDQIRLALEIKSEVTSLLESVKNTDAQLPRYFINSIDNASAYEIIRELTGGRLMPGQIDMAINAIKTQSHGSVFQASKNVNFHFSTRFFTLKLLK